MEANKTEAVTNYLCNPFNTPEKYATLQVTGWLSMAIYLVILLLGSFNMYHILVKQRYYKSLFLTLQYVFGVLICVTRIVSTTMVLVTLIRLKQDICGVPLFVVLTRKLDEFDKILQMLNWGFYLTAFSMAFKVCLGVITFCMVLSLYLKIRIIYEKEGY